MAKLYDCRVPCCNTLHDCATWQGQSGDTWPVCILIYVFVPSKGRATWRDHMDYGQPVSGSSMGFGHLDDSACTELGFDYPSRMINPLSSLLRFMVCLVLLAVVCSFFRPSLCNLLGSGYEDKIAYPNLQAFGFTDIKVATSNFSHENKLGEAGFGPVYKYLPLLPFKNPSIFSLRQRFQLEIPIRESVPNVRLQL
ncbi:hypothetical protein RHSIM_Rhsim01G0037300 [Rhododendron simsii]|uniref:Uncharacterized protein n=1 Tax=Rhododendron simsii TaxID=118357 RepID=A0A834M0Z9_RHOSS|nr:hypothetical protein RHSIM_Rhsim01G0037300 [Rhododendron simsii]